MKHIYRLKKLLLLFIAGAVVLTMGNVTPDMPPLPPCMDGTNTKADGGAAGNCGPCGPCWGGGGIHGLPGNGKDGGEDGEDGEDGTCGGGTFEPIYYKSANMFREEVDLDISLPGIGLDFVRYYNSRDLMAMIHPDFLPMGYGWTHTYNIRTIALSAGIEWVGVYLPDGYGLIFYKPTMFSCCEDPAPPYNFTPWNDNHTTLRLNADLTYTWTTKDQWVYDFDQEGYLQSIADRNGNLLTLSYDPVEKLLLSVTDNFSNSLSFTYNGDNELEAMTDPAGNRYQYESVDGNLVSVTYPDMTETTYFYEDPADPHNLTKVIDQNGHIAAQYGYDDMDKPVYMSLEKGNYEVNISYVAVSDFEHQATVTNSQGLAISADCDCTGFIPRVAKVKNCLDCGDDTEHEYTYDQSFNLTKIVDQDSNTTEMTYDNKGNMLTKTEAVGTPLERTKTYTYHSLYNFVTSMTEDSVASPGDNKVTTLQYDTNGNLTKEIRTGFISPGVQYTYVTTYGYNGYGQLTFKDGPRTDLNDIATAEYNPTTGFLTSLSPPLVGPITFGDYDVNGNLGSLVDLNGNRVEFDWDEMNRLTTRTFIGAGTGGSDIVTEYNYDDFGNLVSLRLPEGNAICYEYDETDRLTMAARKDSPFGNILESASYLYDKEGNITRVEYKDAFDDLKYFRNYSYDELNRLWRVNNPDGNFVEFTYDGSGGIINIKDVDGQTREISYDNLDRTIEVIRKNTEYGDLTTSYGYDSMDNLTSITDANGNTTFMNYTDEGWRAQVNSPDAGLSEYTFDPAGNIVSGKNANNIVKTFGYDGLNRLTKVGFPDTSENVYFSFDDPGVSNGIGKLTGMQDPSGTSTYHYNALAMLLREERTIDSKTYTTNYTYDNNNDLIAIDYPSGRSVYYTRDAADRIIEISGYFDGTPTTYAESIEYFPFGGLSSLSYGNGNILNIDRDNLYRITSITAGTILNRTYTHDTRGNVLTIMDHLDSSKDQTFTYDALHQLISATGILGSGNYSYDGQGNRQTKVIGTDSTSYAYINPGNNRVSSSTGAGNFNYTYDLAGNIISDGILNFEYNQNNHLAKVLNGSGIAGEYIYQGRSFRERKITSAGTTLFLYDQYGRFLEEISEGSGEVRDYIYLNDQPIVLSISDTTSDATYYYHNDHLATPLKMTNELGDTVWSADYLPFGKVDIATGSIITNNLRFPGHYWDEESGLHFNYFRYYDTKLGRYLRTDPIGFRLEQLRYLTLQNLPGIGLYLYVSNDPINSFDYFGLEEKCKPWWKRWLEALGFGVSKGGDPTPIPLGDLASEQGMEAEKAMLDLGQKIEDNELIDGQILRPETMGSAAQGQNPWPWELDPDYFRGLNPTEVLQYKLRQGWKPSILD